VTGFPKITFNIILLRRLGFPFQQVSLRDHLEDQA
jgi:hypothetical protein